MALGLVGSPTTHSVLSDSQVFTKTGVTAGNWLIIAFSSFLGVGMSSVSGGGLSWNRAVVGAGTNDQVELWYALATSSTDYSITVDLTGTGAAITGGLIELTDGAASSILDKTNNAAPSGTSLNSGATGTLSQADEIIFACMTHDGGAPSITEEGGWTLIYEQENNNDRQSFSFVFKIVSSTSSEEHTWTIGASVGAHTIIASFKAAGGSGDQTLTPSPATITFTAPAAAVAAGASTQSAGVNSITVTAPSATLVATRTLAAGVNAIAVTAAAATAVPGTSTRTAGANAITVTSAPATISAGANFLTAGAQAIGVTAPPAAVAPGTSTQLAGPNAIVFTVPPATIPGTQTIAALPATVLVTAPPASVFAPPPADPPIVRRGGGIVGGGGRSAILGGAGGRSATITPGSSRRVN